MNYKPHHSKDVMIKKKILFILPSTVGGSERMTVTISKLFTKKEADIKYVIVHKTLGDIAKFIPNDREIIHVKIHTIWDAVTLRLLKIFKKEKPTHVFCSLRYLSIRVILAAKICGNIKIIVRSDNVLDTIINRKRTFLPFIYTYPWADVIIAQQEEMQEELYNILSKKNPNVNVVCLHNLLDTTTINRFKDAPSPYIHRNEIRFVWTARFAKNKGQDLLVKAFILLHEILPNAHLYLVGEYSKEDDFYKKIHEYVLENGMTNFVHFVGFDSNPYKWVVNADCFVMPSRVEGLPNALIEAMYLGKPVVATKCIPIISRIIEDGYNGILAESENFKSLADAMIKSLSLKNFKMTYKPSTQADFKNLFS